MINKNRVLNKIEMVDAQFKNLKQFIEQGDLQMIQKMISPINENLKVIREMVSVERETN